MQRASSQKRIRELYAHGAAGLFICEIVGSKAGGFNCAKDGNCAVNESIIPGDSGNVLFTVSVCVQVGGY